MKKDTIEHYRKILEILEKRIETKDRTYGTSYLNKTDSFMIHRLEGEIYEMKVELYAQNISYNNLIDEACDVAIIALLIANKARLAKQEMEDFE